MIRALAALLFLTATAAGAAPHLDLDLSLDPASRQLSAQASLTLTGPAADIALPSGLEITRLELDGRSLAPPATGRMRLPPGPHTLRLDYRGVLAPLTRLDHRAVLGPMPAMADPEGSFLPAGGGWYPDPGEAFGYRLRLSLPAGQKGLAPGALARESEGQGGYRADYVQDQPADGIDLMAGPYRVTERLIPRPGRPPLRLRTWFYPDLADLADAYLDDSARYIARYDAAIGAYPFDAFDIVAAPLPTGFGMPGLTYLGRDVLRLPFIRATSLGHEILHNWWGNGVIPDWATGNWSEGLTTFMADYAYKEDQSPDAAREARLGWLRDLAAVPAAADSPLADFTSRRHGIASIVGYDKAAMVFLMLRDEIGAEAFDRGLRRFWQRHRFQRAGWIDLERAFAEAAGRDLSGFFQQWLQRAGAPDLKLGQASWADGRLDLSLTQTGPAYRLNVPLRLDGDPAASRVVDIADGVTRLTLPAPEPVRAVTLDPDYRLWRHLPPDRFPAILREIIVAPQVGLLPAGEDMAAQAQAQALALAERLLDHPPTPLSAAGPGLPGLDPVLIVGQTAAVDALLARLGLAPRPPRLNGKGSAQVWAARDRSGRPYAVVSARDADALQALHRPLPHYGRQSWLIFDAAKAVDKGIWPAQPESVEVERAAK